MKRFFLFFLASVTLVGCTWDDPSTKLVKALMEEALEKQEQSVQPGIEFCSEFDAAPVVPGESDETSIYFNSNMGWKAEATSSWFSISPKEGEPGNGSVVIKAEANEEFDTRSGKITFTSGFKTFTITVVQSPKSAIILENDSFEVGKDGGTITVVVKTTVGFEHVVPRECQEWIGVEPYTKSLETRYVQLNIAENKGVERTGYVDLVNKEKGLSTRVTVTQEAGWIEVTGVSLDKTELTITVGDADVKLTATVAPDDATDKTVSWSSDNTDVATVDDQGNVHAVAVGTANITVTTTDGGKTATCAVTVTIELKEILATNPDFPESNNLTVPVNAWENSTNSSYKAFIGVYSGEKYFCFGSSSLLALTLSTAFEKTGDNSYSITDDNDGVLIFSLTEGKVSSFTYQPASSSSYKQAGGTYAPRILPAGALAGEFSVSATKKVRFSQGNLYWNGDSFKFESAQYEIQTIWSTSHVSHFYWSKDASVAIEKTYSDPGAADGDVFFTNETVETAKSDFTVNDVTGKYRTLSAEEWKYLFNNHSYKWASVNGVNGCVLAPDDFAGTLADSYTDDAALAADNLVFLPAAGARSGSDIADNGTNGSYWSSSEKGNAYMVYFNISGVNFDNILYPRDLGISVRLVTEVPAE